MKIVIACPPIRDFYLTPHRMVSLGTEVLRKRLTADGHRVVVFNFPQGDGCFPSSPHNPQGRSYLCRTIPLPRELSYLKPFILENETGPVSFFSKYRHWGPDFSECAGQIIREQPDLLCISSFAYAYAEDAVALSLKIKAMNPRLFILAGGAGPSVHPQYYLENSGIDAVLTGEGEKSLGRFIAAYSAYLGTEDQQPRGLESTFSGKFPGLFFRFPLRMETFNQHTIPDNDPDPIIAGTGRLVKKRRYSVSIARGCPKICRFCSNYIVHGRKFRKCAKEKVENIIHCLKNRIDSEEGASNPYIHFNFEDDNLLIDPGYLLAVCEIFRDHFPLVSFSAENGLDYTLLTPSRADRLINIGFIQFNFSFVAAEKISLTSQNRVGDTEAFRELVMHIASRGIPVISYFIAGFETDTKQGLADSLIFLATLPTVIGISPFYAVPGMAGFEDLNIFRGLKPRLSLGSSLFPWTKSLATECLATAFRLSRLLNLMKKKRSPMEDKLLSLFNRENKLFTLIRRGKKIEIIPVPRVDEELVHLVGVGIKKIE